MGKDYIDMVHDKSWKYAFRNAQIFWNFIYSYFNKDLARSMESINTEHTSPHSRLPEKNSHILQTFFKFFSKT